MFWDNGCTRKQSEESEESEIGSENLSWTLFIVFRMISRSIHGEIIHICFPKHVLALW